MARSKLSFMLKCIERADASRLNDYIVANNLLPRLQSHQKRHSMATAMLRALVRLLDSSRSAARYTAVIAKPLGRFQLCQSHDSAAASVFSVWTDRRCPQ